MWTGRRKIAAGIAAFVALALGGAAIAGAGGTVNATERDSEKGATFEVEVTKSDGSTVDVRLDASYGVVAIDSDSEQVDDGDGEE